MKAIDALEILTRRVGFERNIGDKLFHSLIAGKNKYWINILAVNYSVAMASAEIDCLDEQNEMLWHYLCAVAKMSHAEPVFSLYLALHNVLCRSNSNEDHIQTMANEFYI